MPAPLSTLRRIVVRTVLGAIVVGALVVGGTAFRVWQTGRIDDRSHADVVLVLGAAQYNGRPSDVLKARLDHARTLYDAGVAGEIVTVGGSKPGDKYTEAQAGQGYLAGHGVPVDKVTAVNTGSDTLASMQAAAEVFRKHGWHSAVIVTDPWHSLRSRTMAEDSGIDAWTSPTHSGPVVRTRETQGRYILYETAALLDYRLTKAPADDAGAGLG